MAVHRLDDDLFKIDLPAGSRFSHLEWRADLPTKRFDCHSIVVLPMKQLIEFSEANPNIPFVRKTDDWDQEKVERYIDGNTPGKFNMTMPRIGFTEGEYHRVEEKWFGLRKKYIPLMIPYLGYVNGRHRTRIAENLGASELPMQTDNSYVPVIKKYIDVIDVY